MAESSAPWHSMQPFKTHICSTHAVATIQNSGANLDLMAVHTPIVLIPALPHGARHDVFRDGPLRVPLLLHCFQCVLAVVVCAGLMSHARHILESSPPQDPRRPEAASEFAARPWLGFFTPQAHITAMARGREHVPRVARGP